MSVDVLTNTPTSLVLFPSGRNSKRENPMRARGTNTEEPQEETTS
jgi:hypothetical protein